MAWALLDLRASLPPPAERQVALVWAEQVPGAGESLPVEAGIAGPPPAEAARREPAAPAPTPAPATQTPPDEAEPDIAPEAPTANAAPAGLLDRPLPPPPPAAPPPPLQRAATTPSDRPPAVRRSNAAAAAVDQARSREPAPEGGAAGQVAALAAPASGGEARGAVTPPRQRSGRHSPPPEYPYASRLRQEQGRVILRVEIDTTGRVAGVSVATSSGHPNLDRAALEAVRRWRFEPALADGVPAFAATLVGITFQLEGDRRW
ncbi:energy transducer TonB [Roseomonas sp. BU-1]|uniref:Energy transducer TonB n=2 Tax=Falsiroseomonas selenitidurans TaxID=2716335 RepID=A0ABX1E3Y7_9PROT|nr:energy transducer TonB [Falsiroseomonas selenitidurans]